MNRIEEILTMVIPLVLAVTLHEAAHAYVADKKGDPTARHLGRISMNPIVHIDPLGTLIIPFFMYITTGFIFGYAKPVPVNPYQLHRPKQDMAWVAAAGPGMNLLLAVVSGLLFRALDSSSPQMSLPLMILMHSVMINLWLMAFNLIPIPPLDGGRVLVGLLPDESSRWVRQIEPYGMIVISLLVFFDPFDLIPKILAPIVHGISRMIYTGVLTNFILFLFNTDAPF